MAMIPDLSDRGKTMLFHGRIQLAAAKMEQLHHFYLYALTGPPSVTGIVSHKKFRTRFILIIVYVKIIA